MTPLKKNAWSRSVLITLAGILLVLPSPACLRAQTNDVSETKKHRVICFGDSITKRGYSDILTKRLQVDAVNAGVAGNSTAQALRRMRKDVLDRNPDVVIIFFGTNDLRVDEPKVFVKLEDYRTNLKKMIDNCRSIQAEVILCTLPPIIEDKFFKHHERQDFESAGGLEKLIQDYRRAATKVAKDNSVPLVDLNQLLKQTPEWLSHDGIHPSRKGTEIIARHIAKPLESLLSELPRKTQELPTKPTAEKTSPKQPSTETEASASQPFVHPGIAHTAANLAFVKEKITSDDQLWQNAFEKLKRSRHGRLTWKPDPRPHVQRGVRNNPNIGASDYISDGMAAYTHSLLWVLTEKEDHAKKSAEILNAWSAELETISNHDAQLLVGMAGHLYCNAAELLKHRWDGWPEKDQQQFEEMLNDVLYPVIKDFYPSANGNWDASMLQTMIAMGIFLDDREMFERATEYYRSGEGNGAITNYFNEFGECQESGRDQVHTQMGLEFLANTCEFAWSQGVDLYGEADNRLLLGFEYTARFNLGYDVPYEPYKSFEKRYHYKKISNDSRGRIRPMYEKVFNHYHGRQGLDAPFTLRAATATRPESLSSAMLPWGTLMYGQALPEVEPLDEKPTFTPKPRRRRSRRSR